jgi:hypothetical protein
MPTPRVASASGVPTMNRAFFAVIGDRDASFITRVGADVGPFATHGSPALIAKNASCPGAMRYGAGRPRGPQSVVIFRMVLPRYLAFGALLSVATAWAGCSLSYDLDALVGADGGSVVVEGGQVDGSVVPPGDAGADTAEPPPPPLPTCGDERVCAVSAAAGWSLAFLSTAPDSPCPAGTKDDGKVVELPASIAAAQCTCTCGSATTPGTCTGNATLGIGIGNCALVTTSVPPNGTCTSLGGNYSGTFDRITPPGVTQAACPASLSTTLPTATPTGKRVCVADAPTSAGCEAGRSCVAKESTALTLCVVPSAGAPDCPGDYPKRHTVGASATDNRKCNGTCACETQDTCAVTSAQFHSQSDCSGSSFSFVGDDVCRSAGSTGYNAVKITAARQAGAACKATSGATPGGTIDLTSPRIVCCR